MKRVFSLLLFFVAAMSVQTVQAQVNGDVNGDGKVNEQDIAAILEIMAEAGGVKEPTKYYWYAGWTIPTAENIAIIVNEANASLEDQYTPVNDISIPGHRVLLYIDDTYSISGIMLR